MRRYSQTDRIPWNSCSRMEKTLSLRDEHDPALVFEHPGFFHLCQRDLVYINREGHLGDGRKHLS